MSLTTVVLAGRAAAERNMIDVATVTSTSSTVDQNTGAEVIASALIYTGKCKVQSGATQESTPEAGGATVTVQRSEIHFPVGSFRPAIGQVITIAAVVPNFPGVTMFPGESMFPSDQSTVSQPVAALDPYLAGRVFRVVALLHKSAGTAYRLSVSEVV